MAFANQQRISKCIPVQLKGPSNQEAKTEVNLIIKHIPVKLKGSNKSKYPITSLDVHVALQGNDLEVEVVFNNFGTPELTLWERLFGRRYREINGIFVDRKTQCVASIEFSTRVFGCFASIMRDVESVSALISQRPQIDACNAIEASQALLKYREVIASACGEYVRNYF